MIDTIQGPMDEALLIKHESHIDNENEKTDMVEYCLVGCSGEAHKTGQADVPNCFCVHHVHRSAHVTLKTSVVSIMELGKLNG